ncbi:hypothetical protein AZE42_10635 [Rhizopogon vesiculosus]|uniref:Uncharacterized protein n=1 Tax=Rhizopogon vesiculosus TaxID=180088 RepID=A0A1J8QSG4_9AGAM|nr:hypothetical protein AZE42_10635 [Rhizopogon vesiculosus]
MLPARSSLRALDHDEHTAYELALQSNAEKEVLGCVESQFNRLEGLAIARGLTDEDLGMIDDDDSSDSQG